jgi:transposase-like protein
MDITSHAASRLDQGASCKQIAKELGLAEATLLYWCKDSTGKKVPEGQPMGFRPVEVRDERGDEQRSESSSSRTEPGSRPVVVLLSGIRVEGISLTELPEFLARLECR